MFNFFRKIYSNFAIEKFANLVIFFVVLYFLFSFFGCAAKSSLPLEIIPQPQLGGIIHTVERGETLWRISKGYNVNLEKIVQANKITDRAKIKVGQNIFIPGAKAKKKISKASFKKGNGFIWPVKGKVISYFAENKDHLINKGINIKAKLGSNVLSARSGVVSFCAENLKGYGKTIIIEHNDGFITVYAHNLKNLVSVDDRVGQGTVIAKVGLDQKTQESVLHFQIRKGHRPQNPLYYLP